MLNFCENAADLFLRRCGPRVICCAAAVGISLMGSFHDLNAQTPAATPSATPAATTIATAPIGSGAWYQIGRTALNTTTGQGFAFGYYTQIAGVNGSLFSGAPSESTAYFSFRSSTFQLVPVKTNGDVNLAIVLPDTFNVYYNPSPSRDWSNPDSFTTGTVVASFTRDQFLLLRIWESFGTEYCHLDSSVDFTFNGATVNIGKVLTGVTLTSIYSNAPLPPLSGYAGVIAFAGQGVVASVPSSASASSAPSTTTPE